MAQSSAFAEGGQGRLYLVIDSTGEFCGEYVLKELKNPKRIERFNTELHAIASLKTHPNVIPLVDSGIYRNPDMPCFVIPEADSTLEDLIKNNIISIEDRLIIFEQVCDGVAYLHTMSIIHRDLKPQNILMFAGKPKVTDLGLCLIAGATRITPASEVVGPRFYMAPELEDGRQPNVGCEADVYSLGKVLYYLLSGGKVFSREKYKERVWRLSKRMGELRFDLFDAVFDKSLTVDPGRRYSNAKELLRGFREIHDKFLNHPQTTLLSKFESMDNALKASGGELEELKVEEWEELFRYAEKSKKVVSIEFLRAACNVLHPKFAHFFARALLENGSKLDPDFISFAAGRLFCLPEHDVFFTLGLQPEHFSYLAMHALNRPNDEVRNAIANWSLFTLRHCDDVLTRLAECFDSLQLEAKHNFLTASMKSPYELKEKFLLELSHDKYIDDVSLEAVIAGLCACGTETAIEQVKKMGNRENMDDRLRAVAKGIILGSSQDTANLLKQYTWKNPVLRIIIDMMQKAHSENDEEEDEIYPTPNLGG